MIHNRARAFLVALVLSLATVVGMPGSGHADDLSSLSCGLRAVIPDGWEYTECCSLDITFQRRDNPSVKGQLEDYHEEDRAVGSAWQEAEQLKSEWEGAIPGSQLSSLSSTTLGGLQAASFTRDTTDKSELMVVAVQGNRVINLFFYAPPGQLYAYQGDIDTIRQNVRY